MAAVPVCAGLRDDRDGLLHRYPSTKAFDVAQFKIFLMLNPPFPLRGFDLEVTGDGKSRGALMEIGSVDLANQIHTVQAGL